MFNLYVDGGGTATSPTYFSFKCLEVQAIQMNRFYLHNLPYEFLPPYCTIVDMEGRQTNNLAELAALYYGLLRFKKDYDYQPVTIYHDSKLCVNWVSGNYFCQKPHLIPWVTAIQDLWWPKIDHQWVPRERIVEILGH